MILLIIVGCVMLISGFIFLSGEKNVRKVNAALTNIFNKVVVKSDDFFLSKRVGTAICLILIGLFCLFIAYWISEMAPPGFSIF